MPRVGFEPTISAGERPQTRALDRAAIVFITMNLLLIPRDTVGKSFICLKVCLFS